MIYLQAQFIFSLSPARSCLTFQSCWMPLNLYGQFFKKVKFFFFTADPKTITIHSYWQSNNSTISSQTRAISHRQIVQHSVLIKNLIQLLTLLFPIQPLLNTHRVMEVSIIHPNHHLNLKIHQNQNLNLRNKLNKMLKRMMMMIMIMIMINIIINLKRAWKSRKLHELRC